MLHTLTIKLKQHTPLIHFQHDQYGATLRASEVKPKLDKYLLQCPNVLELGQKKGWIDKKDDKTYSLRYKMLVTVLSEKPEEFLLASYVNKDKVEKIERMKSLNVSIVSNSPFFAQEKQNGMICRQENEKDAREKWNLIEKKGILFSSPINLRINCTDEYLANLIAEQIQSFFLSTNFGSRQSKGFGGFTVESIFVDQHQIKLNNNTDLLCRNFSFVYQKTLRDPSIKSIFSQINDDYRLLKSGSRRPYAHSKLMYYESQQGYRWEKKYIKKDFIEFPFKDENDKDYQLKSEHPIDNVNDKGEYRFVRAVLGLSEQYEFLLANQTNKKLIVRIKNKDIERYQSPLLFKVINDSIFIVGREINQEILDKQFEFIGSIQNDEDAGSDTIGKLKTPSDFSLIDFMDYAMNDAHGSVKLNYRRLK